MQLFQKMKQSLLASDQSFLTRPINQSYDWGIVDSIGVHKGGLIWLMGWIRPTEEQLKIMPKIKFGESLFAPTDVFRMNRPDLTQAYSLPPFSGIFWEFNLRQLVPQTLLNQKVSLSVFIDSQELISGYADLEDVYFHRLLSTDRVFHRNDIYTSAPTPPTVVSQEIVEIASTLPEPILDFGCGLGVLVSALLERKKEVRGLDLNIPSITKNIVPGAAGFVDFYEGKVPTYIPDKSFASVICSECLEHIPNFSDTILELSRIVKTHIFITVPNLDAIPLLAPQYAVPWHLLEGDHKNFFTIRTLKQQFMPYFQNFQSFRLHEKSLNGTTYFANLGLLCSRPDK